MTSQPEPRFQGRHSRVLNHPDHLDGVNHGEMEIRAIATLAPTVTRLTALLHHDGDDARWFVTNPAIRIELPDDTGQLVSRVYTVRSAKRTNAGLMIDIDVVRHGSASPVMRWLAQLTIGARTRIFGPRAHFCPHVEPSTRTAPDPTAAPIGLFADETAIPALATILRDWPAHAVGEAWVETPDQQVVADLPSQDNVTIHWLTRDPQTPPGTSGALAAAAHTFSAAYPQASSVWACGEFGAMKVIRDLFRKQHGLSREQVVVFGYWRTQASGTELDEARIRRMEQALQTGGQLAAVDDFDDEE